MPKCWEKSEVRRMKKAATILSCLLFALTLLFPAGVFTAIHFGYMFEPTSCFAFALITAILSVCTVAVSFQTEDAIQSRVLRVLFAIITPFSLFNVSLYIVLCIYNCNISGVIISAFVSAGCCCFLTVKYGKPLILKIIVLVLSAFMALPISFNGFVISVFTHNTVLQTVESPDGKYYAEVIVSDHGALGGDTVVDVYEKSGIDCIIRKWPQNVYSGNWTSHINMEIYWKDEQSLVINAVEYAIE